MRRTARALSATALAGAALGAAASAASADPAAEVSPGAVEPGGTVTVSVTCDGIEGSPPDFIDATSEGFEEGKVQLRRVEGAGQSAAGAAAYRGTARAPQGGEVDGGPDTVGAALEWGVDGACPGATGGRQKKWKASYTVARGNTAASGTAQSLPAGNTVEGPLESDGGQSFPDSAAGQSLSDSAAGQSLSDSAAGQSLSDSAAGQSLPDSGTVARPPDSGTVEPPSDSGTGQRLPEGDTAGRLPDSDTGQRPPDSDTGQSPPDSDTGQSPPDSDTGQSPPDSDTGQSPPDSDTGQRPPDSDAVERPPESGSGQRPPTIEGGVQAGEGGAFTDSVPALVAGSVLIAGALGAAVHRLRRKDKSRRRLRL
ncbi:hypothetical protein [Streptomyces sp. NBC_00996]|uniref:hypothetical protein n=1 Tax=Streptomyces sp. NBC_00996 TaxID=2903710 RepID=UPI0038647785|nr:hypothetical protein OG390_42035 [Streptomyces sp. NBC_00996]